MLLAFATTGWADDWADCSGTDPDLSIRGCSNIIAVGRESRDNVAIAYIDRGIAYGNKGDYDQEIADETKAIELKPDNGYAYYNRGNAYTHTYTSSPDNQNPLTDFALRGSSRSSQKAKALTDFRTAARLIPASDQWHGQALARIDEQENYSAAMMPQTPTMSSALAAELFLREGGAILNCPASTKYVAWPMLNTVTTMTPSQITLRPSDSTRILPMPMAPAASLTRSAARTITR
jgi:hypothetical protein